MTRRWLPLSAVLAVSLVLLPARSAHAENKDMVRLEAEISDLRDAVQKLQQSNDERMGVLRDLVQQTADSVNKMTLTTTSLKLELDNSAGAAEKRNEALAGQIQALNDSLDELKARLGRMEKTLGNVQDQQAQMSAVIGNLPQGGAAVPAASAPATSAPPVTAVPGRSTAGQPGTPLPMPDASGVAPARPGATQPPPTASASSSAMYRTAYSDYMAGKNSLAASEFGDLIKAYPDDNLSGNAYFYLGEMDLRSNKPSSAIKNYDAVIERYPNNAKIPAAHLHKAQALADTRQQEAAQRELRALIQRFPASPEAAQARSRMGGSRR